VARTQTQARATGPALPKKGTGLMYIRIAQAVGGLESRVRIAGVGRGSGNIRAFDLQDH